MPVSQNVALYSLLGTVYGGNANTSFNLPDLRGTTPICETFYSAATPQGQRSGAETVTLTTAQLPPHNHVLTLASAPANKPNNNPTKNRSYGVANANLYTTRGTNPLTTLNAGTLVPTGGGQAHDNMQPYTTVNFCIVLAGVYPMRP